MLLLLALLTGWVAAFAVPLDGPFLVEGADTAYAGEAPIDARRVVAIQPLGGLDPAMALAVAEAVAETFAVQVEVLPPRPLPPSAFYRPRRRYRGERILASLENETPSRFSKVLGIMSADLSVTKGQVYDWGIMGVAGLSKRAAVVSIHRLCRGSAPASRVARRIRQVAIHELGHTFGLRHCASAHCIMNDAKGGIHAVDNSTGRFCPQCRRELGSVIVEHIAAR